MKATKAQAEAELREAGATLERKEDRWGDTRTGWWLDGVYLGKTADEALAAMKG